MYEVDPEMCDKSCISLAGDPYAPFPYQLSIFNHHIDIYSGDGRIIATVMRDNFTTYGEYLETARLLAYSYCWLDFAGYAMSYVNMLRAGSPSSFPETYEEKSKEFYAMHEALHYSGIYGGEDMYELVYYASRGFEPETELAYWDEPRTPAWCSV